MIIRVNDSVNPPTLHMTMADAMARKNALISLGAENVDLEFYKVAVRASDGAQRALHSKTLTFSK